jgi:hypothetical protein
MVDAGRTNRLDTDTGCEGTPGRAMTGATGMSWGTGSATKMASDSFRPHRTPHAWSMQAANVKAEDIQISPMITSLPGAHSTSRVLHSC